LLKIKLGIDAGFVQSPILLNPLRKDINLYLDPTSFSLEGGGICCRSILRDTDISFRTFDKLLFQRYNLPASLFLSLISEVALMLCWNTNLKRFSNIYPIGIPSENETLFLVEDVVNGALNALSGAQEPFLAYLHFYPPHAPYRPRREFVGVFDDNWMPVSKGQHFFSEGWSRDDLNQERTRYDEYIAHVDAEFGRMYESLEENGLTQNSYIIITSDHGKLFERGVRGHSTPLLYEPVIRVPLLISKPGQQEREDVHAPTSCIDVLPTLLHATGQPVPDWCEGELLPDLGGTADSDRSVFSVEAKENPAHAPLRQGTVALRRGDYKLIHYFGYSGYEDEYELYDLEEDPEELHDLYSSKTSVAAALRHQLKAKLREVNRPYLQGD
jgi:arylsulfatase A-like enzyme